jgi:hypothetical protein
MTNYEAVPIDVELQKVTAGESAALSRHKRHENINTLLGNENTPLLIGAGVLVAFLPFLIDLFLQAQEDELNITLTDLQKTAVKASITGYISPTLLGSQFGKGLGRFAKEQLEKL